MGQNLLEFVATRWKSWGADDLHPESLPGGPRPPATCSSGRRACGESRRSRAAHRVVVGAGLLAEEQARRKELVTALDEDLFAGRIHAANDGILAPAFGVVGRQAHGQAGALVDSESHELGAPAVCRPLGVEDPHPARLRRDVSAREATPPRFLLAERLDELLFH